MKKDKKFLGNLLFEVTLIGLIIVNIFLIDNTSKINESICSKTVNLLSSISCGFGSIEGGMEYIKENDNLEIEYIQYYQERIPELEKAVDNLEKHLKILYGKPVKENEYIYRFIGQAKSEYENVLRELEENKFKSYNESESIKKMWNESYVLQEIIEENENELYRRRYKINQLKSLYKRLKIDS